MAVNLATNTVESTLQQQFEESILKELASFGDTVYKLADSLFATKTTIREIEDEVQEIVRAAAEGSMCPDPEVEARINNLKLIFQMCITDGKAFLRACVTMASYATDEEHLAEIKEELMEGDVDELKTFVTDLSEFLQKCTEKSKVFQESRSEMVKEADATRKEYTEKVNKSEENAEKHIENFSDAHCDKNRARVGQMMSGVAASAVLTAGKIGALSPQMSLFAAALSAVGGAFVGQMYQINAASESFKEKRASETNLKKKEIYTKALHRISKLQRSMNDAVAFIYEMSKHTESTLKLIGLEYIEESKKKKNPKRLKSYFKIKTTLESVSVAMKSIKDKLGQDGENISCEPDTLISNTQGQQSTDTEDTNLPNYFETTLRITTPPLAHPRNSSPPITTTAVAETGSE